jgi:cardiolipin synthase
VTRRDLPNAITLLRILSVAPLVWALLDDAFGVALALFLLASASDGLDGFLARRYGWQSQLGAILDPIADKALLVALYLALGLDGFLPWWLVLAVIGRDLVILGGALAYRLVIGRFDIAPTFLSKLNTVLQFSLALVVILARGLGWLPPWSADLLVYAVLASTLLSGIHYVVIWSRRTWQEKHR